MAQTAKQLTFRRIAEKYGLREGAVRRVMSSPSARWCFHEDGAIDDAAYLVLISDGSPAMAMTVLTVEIAGILDRLRRCMSLRADNLWSAMDRFIEMRALIDLGSQIAAHRRDIALIREVAAADREHGATMVREEIEDIRHPRITPEQRAALLQAIGASDGCD